MARSIRKGPYVEDSLLNKVEALSDAERAQLERHVQVGLVTLAPLQPPPKVRQIILHHHENYDGTGYPKGLAGEAIPLGSRLVALSDSLRALLQRRPWRRAVPLADALAEIQALTAQIPGARLRLFPEAGHSPHSERGSRDKCNQVVREFLQESA